VGHRRAGRPVVELTASRLHADFQAGRLDVREATLSKPVLQADCLVAALRANLSRATEPALITRLRDAIDRVQAARRGAP
jgi:hypothetical protein